MRQPARVVPCLITAAWTVQTVRSNAVGQRRGRGLGVSRGRNAASVVDGVPTIARSKNGAIVSARSNLAFFQLDSIRIALNKP